MQDANYRQLLDVTPYHCYFFTGRQLTMQSPALAIVDVSICLSVRHVLALYQNDAI